MLRGCSLLPRTLQDADRMAMPTLLKDAQEDCLRTMLRSLPMLMLGLLVGLILGLARAPGNWGAMVLVMNPGE